MKWLNNLKVGKKLSLLIVCSLIGLLAVGGTGYLFLSSSSKSLDSMYNERLVSSEWINECRIHARAVSADIFRLMVTTDKIENESIIKDIDIRATEFNNYINFYKKSNLDKFETDKLNEIQKNLDKYREGRKNVIDLAIQNKNEEAYEVYKKNVDSYAEAFLKNMVEIGEHNKQIAEELNNTNKSNFKLATSIFLGIVCMASILIILLGWSITKRITKRLNDFVIFIGELAEGNFSRKIASENLKDKSEFGIVSKALDKMTINIINLIKQLGNTSEQLLSSSQELTASAEQSSEASNLVASSVTDVANGADEQRSLSNNTVEIVENMSDKIDRVSENTTSVSILTDNAENSANAGEEAVEKAVNQMVIIEQRTNETSIIISELEKKSVKIGQIIDTIESISTETNLLALNAAIEAARAGESGRGFSVVADEIRKLAEQSQEATKEITEIIGDVQAKTNSAVSVMSKSTTEVELGTKVVNSAGTSFREILQLVRKISEQIHEISNSITEITVGTKTSVTSVKNIQNISIKIADETQTIAAVAEEQSASVEEIAMSSKILSQMSEDLHSIIDKFKI